jgi:hypothetical protein
MSNFVYDSNGVLRPAKNETEILVASMERQAARKAAQSGQGVPITAGYNGKAEHSKHISNSQHDGKKASSGSISKSNNAQLNTDGIGQGLLALVLGSGALGALIYGMSFLAESISIVLPKEDTISISSNDLEQFDRVCFATRDTDVYVNASLSSRKKADVKTGTAMGVKDNPPGYIAPEILNKWAYIVAGTEKWYGSSTVRGYISRNALQNCVTVDAYKASQSATPPSTATPPPTTPTFTHYVTTQSSPLNVRKNPSTDEPIIGKISKGSCTTVIGSTKNAWAQVAFSVKGEVKQGYTSTQFLKPIPNGYRCP